MPQSNKNNAVDFDSWSEGVLSNPDYAGYSKQELRDTWDKHYGISSGKPAKEPGFVDRLKQGVKDTFTASKIAVSDNPGDIASTIADAETNSLPPSEAQQRMAGEIKPAQDDYTASTGVAALGAFASLAAQRISQFVSNPKEFAGMMAQNLPNSVPGLAGAVAGGAAGGSVLGPPGAAAVAVVGGTAGGYLIEQGSAMREQIIKEAQARGIDLKDAAALEPLVREKYQEFLGNARLKGIGTAGTDAVLNALTLGVAGAGQRAIVKDARALAAGSKAGTVTTDAAATGLADLTARTAARNTVGSKIGRGAGVAGAEMVGESASEAAGQQLAYGKVDMLDVIDEGLLGAGQGAAMAATSGLLSKSMGLSENDTPESAIQAARLEIGKQAADRIKAADAIEDQHAAQQVQGIMAATTVEEAIAAATSEKPAVFRNGADIPTGVDAPVSGTSRPLGGDIETPAYLRAAGAPATPESAVAEAPVQQAEVPTAGSVEERAGQAFMQAMQRVSPRAFEALVSAAAKITGAQDLPSLGAALATRFKDRAFWSQLAAATGDQKGTVTAAAYQAMQIASKQSPELMSSLIHIKDAGKIGAAETPDGAAGPQGSLQDVAFRDQEAAQGAAATLDRTGEAAFESPQGARLKPVDATADGKAVEALKASMRADTSPTSAEAAQTGALASLRAISDTGLPGIAMARSFAQKLGRRVVVVDSDGDTAPFNGATVGRADQGDAKGVLFIHAKTKRPAMAVIGHELLHTLSPEIRAKLLKALSPMIGKGAIEKKMSLGLTKDQAIEEVLADLVGNRFTEASFWKFLERRDPGLFREFAQRAIEVIGRILEAMKSGLGLFGADEGLSTSKLRRARAVIADAITEHARSLTPEEQKQLGWNGLGSFASNNQAIVIGGADEPAAKKIGRAEIEIEEPKRLGYEGGNRGTETIALGDGKSKDEPPARKIGRAEVDVPQAEEPKRLGFEPGARGTQTIAVAPAVADEPPAKVIGRVDVGDVNTDPSEAQKEAGNYKKGHVSFEGLDLTIENPVGSERSGKDKGGKPWSVTMTAHYGYIKRTVGADEEHIDAYLAKDPIEGAPVYVFDQYNRGKFDEHKVILGVASRQQAASLYDAHFSDGSGPKRRLGLKQMSLPEFKEWIKNGNTKQPAGVKGSALYSAESTGDGTGRPDGGRAADRALPATEQANAGLQPLAGAPSVRGASGPDARIVGVAEKYARSIGVKLERQSRYAEVDEDRARRIADAYEAMEHAPQDPKVKEAYENLIAQTTAQYRALEKAGYKFWFINISTEAGQDYASTPWNAMRDLRANQSMGVFPTEEGFGSGATELNVDDNPLLADTGIKWPSGSLDGEPKRVLANDLFRAVHDALGHGIEGSGFRAQGEENAWQAHARLFTGSALGALTSETRGQNSWLNYGPHGAANRNAKTEDTIFADQKTGLMPSWTWTEGVVGDRVLYSIEQSDISRLGPVGKSLLKQPNGWAIMTAENPDAKMASAAENERAMRALIADLEEQGLKYVAVNGKYGNDEKSLLIVGDIDPAEMARKYRQESVLTPKGFVYQDGSVQPAKGVNFYDKKPADFFTEVPGGLYFAMDIDWDAPRKADVKFSAESPSGIDLTRSQRAASLDKDLYDEDFKLSAATPNFKNQAEFGEYLNERLGRNTFAGNYGPQALKHVAGLLAHEGILAAQQRKNAGSWYRNSIEGAMTQAAKMYPEIGSGSDARFLFSVALAITSNGQAIADNVRMAFEAYDSWDKDGSFTRSVEGAGDRTTTINNGFKRFNDLVKRSGSVASIRKFMLTMRPVREIEDSLDLKINGENRDSVVYGAAVLGPKIGGGFLPNLNGQYDALTIDRWLARTYNRMTGNMLGAKGEMVNGPRNGSERQFLRDAFERAVEMMSDKGYTVQQADLQALLWYPEKDLYTKYGVSDVRAAPTDYEIEVTKYVEKALSKGRKRDAAGRSESARRRAAPDGDAGRSQGALFSAESRDRAAGAARTGTPEFKAWFGDSVVTDTGKPGGKPLVVYHGTATPGFSAFDPAQARSEGGAFFFSHSSLMKNPATNANGYATRRGGAVDDGAVMPVYLRMQNPLIAGFAEPMPEGDEAIGQWLDRMYKFNRKLDADKNGYYQRTIKEARRNGHDGVIFKNVEDERMDGGRRFNDETDVYAVLSPEQIKSAIGNRGTFDPKNADIRFSREYGELDDFDVKDPYIFDLTKDDNLDGPKIVPQKADLYAAQRWLAMAQDKRMFRYPASDQETLENIAYDTAKLKATAWRPADPIERVDGASMVAKITMPSRGPGKDTTNMYVLKDNKGNVWTNVVMLQAGSQDGPVAYQVVANYAHNNGLKFVGDPAGLSDDAVYRRTEQMLASALKFGTTDHLAPHERQQRAGLAWKAGDTEYNIAAMLAWSRDKVVEAVPVLQELTYDAATGDLLDSEGQAVDRQALNAMLDAGGGREVRAGTRTAARTVATNAFIDEYERGEDRSDEELPANMHHISYSAEEGRKPMSLEEAHKSLGQQIKAGVEYTKMLARNHDWMFNEGDILYSKKTGKSYKLTARVFVPIGKISANKYGAAYWYERGQEGSGEYEKGLFHEDRIKETGSLTSLTTPKFSAEPAWVAAGPAALQSAASKIDTYAPATPIADKVKAMSANWQKRLVQGLADSFAPLKELSRDAYIAARMVKSSDGVLEGMLMFGKPKIDADGAISGDLDGKGFGGSRRELIGEHDRFFMWLAGNRSERLLREGKENLFSADEIAAMKALNRGAMKDGSSRETAYSKALADFVAYNKSVMDIAEKTGLIDGEARSLWEHDFYVPFYRVMSEEDKINGPGKIKGLVRQKAFDRLKGGKDNLGDLMENTLRNWSHLLGASLANQAAAKSLIAAEGAGVAIEATGNAAQEMAKSMGKKGGAVYFMDHGKERWFVVDDPFVLAAITSMEAVGLNGLPMKLMGAFKHYLTLGTTIAPAFKVRNLIRDSMAAIGQNEISYNMLGNVAQGWSGTAKTSEDYAQMLFGGALMRFGNFVGDDKAEHVKRLINRGVKDSTILDSESKIKAAMTQVWDTWQDFGDRMENVNRAALYKQLIASGKSHLEASFQARDMMDFSLQGGWAGMRMLTQVVPFLNARVQGLYKLGRAGKEDPARLAYVVGAVALASIGLMLAYQDDEDWKAREDWDRDSFWWIKIGDTAYRIPKPFEIGAMGTIAERSLELIISDEMTGARFAERMKEMVMGTFAMNPIPQMFKPMIDLYANKDSFTGRQIETRGMENLSKSERAGPNTTALGRMLGAAGDTTGISPVQVDHLVRAYTGWLGMQGANIVDAMASPFSDRVKPAGKIDDYLGGFVKTLPTGGSRYLEEFYKQTQAIHEVVNDIKLAREVGDLEKARDLETSEAWKVQSAKLYSQAERQIGKINKQIKHIRNSTEMDPQDKRDRIEALTAQKNQLARVVTLRTLQSKKEE